MDWDLPGAPPQYATPRNPDRDTYGPEVCAVMRRLGFDPLDILDRIIARNVAA